MDSAVQPRGALSFSVLPPPLPALPNEVNLIVPCLASKENCFKRREAEQTLRLASDYAGRDESSPARALSGVKSDKTRPGLDMAEMTKKKFGGLTSKVNQCEQGRRYP